MSVPFGRIYCDACDYIGDTLCAAGYFHYVDEDGRRCWVSREVGWCFECGKVSPLEAITPLSELEPPVPEIAAPEPVEPRSVVDRIRSWWGGSAKDPTIQQRQDELERERVTAELLYRVAQLDRKPVCLTCGSENIHFFEKPDSETRGPKYDISLGLRHPGCGGELRQRDSGGTRIAPVMPRLLYDLNGQRITEKS
jgi:hypothetical protein